MVAYGGRFAGSLNSDYINTEAVLESLFAESSMDAYVSCYNTVDQPGICNAAGGTLEAPVNRNVCVRTGSPSGISVEAVGASATHQRRALTNREGNVTATRTSISLFNLDNYPPGD